MCPRKAITGVPEATERPDRWYWEADYKERRKVTREKLDKLVAEMEAYDRERFVFGRRFRLYKGYHGVPRGTCCTVVSEWPETRVRWDKWAKKGYGSLRRKEDMHFELDIRLLHVPEG